MGFCDYLGAFHTSTARLVSAERAFGDNYVFKFEGEREWKAGEHAVYTIKGLKAKGGRFRPMSIASTTEEGFMMMGTRIAEEPSDFKKALLAMQPGDPIHVRGPFGSFLLKDETAPCIMIAGGIGITPFRALLKDIHA
ncbi:phenol hydroxylase reductase, partial [Kipferlia bialata]|eukprot:g2572.t1